MIASYRNPASDHWYTTISEDLSQVPLRFSYDGREYCGFSETDFTVLHREVKHEEEKETQTIRFAFACDLCVTLIMSHYFDYGVTEWTVWFENTGTNNSALLENIRCCLRFTGERPVLKGILGDHVNQYSPYSETLEGRCIAYSSDSGRATHGNFPYFNLEYADVGVMLAIGWAGTWKACFDGNGDSITYTASAVNGLKTYLKPGEKIRSALFVAAPYSVRSEQYATNYWRSWFVKHNLPKADAAGTQLMPFSTCCLANDTGLPNSDGSISERHTTWKPSLEKMLQEDAKVDFRWFDAGWYVRPDGGSEETDWWGSVGTWELDPAKWPGKTFRESTDFAREQGMKTLVWFEPERVTDPENLVKNYGYDPSWAIAMDGEKTISNNIGDPACLKWVTDRICNMLRENQVELYREDNNCDAAKLWIYMDSLEGNDRKGITECKFIAGHYQMWDDIIACTKSYGGCAFVDSCASGGGRNDLESLRRGVPLLRSDSDRTTASLRLSMTTAFNRWIPFCGANTKEKAEEVALTGKSDPYIWRASYLPVLNVDSQFVQDPHQDFSVLRFGLAEWKKVAPYLLKDFYVLTPWHREVDMDNFTAFCYYNADEKKGVLLAFRQEKCPCSTLPFRIPFARKGEEFRLTDEDTGASWITDGSGELNFEQPRMARLLWVEEV